MRQLAILTALMMASVTPTKAQLDWLQLADEHFSVLYRAGYERDAEMIRRHLQGAESLMKTKYGVALTSYFISVYVHPEATERANVNLALNRCCGDGANGKRVGTIDVLAPSSPLWKSAPPSSLGLAKDGEDYHAKIIVHEYITVGHYAVQDQRPSGGWRYYDAPGWFTDGLQEYDAIFHSTDANRTLLSVALMRTAKQRKHWFSLSASGMVEISDRYNGGAAFLAFLAAEFGEDIHARILLDSAGTFQQALSNVTALSSTALMMKFHEWLDR